MKRIFVAAVLSAFSFSAVGQVQSAQGAGTPRVGSTSKAPYNAAGRDTTPLNCSRPDVRFHPHLGVRLLCERWERRLLQDSARRAGQPAPSSSVVRLPALGSSEAKRHGFACIGGQAFEKLPNGWAQVMAPEGGWQRCEGG